MVPSRGVYIAALLLCALLLCGVLAEKPTTNSVNVNVASLSTQEIEEQLQVRTQSRLGSDPRKERSRPFPSGRI
jgi:hypothetical protein